MTDMKKTYRQPERLAGLDKYSAAITVRFVAEPTKRGEHSLDALDLARNYDALPDIEHDRLEEFIRKAWTRQKGSEEERQEAQSRFERLDWLIYVLNLRREGWTLDALAKHTGETLEEVQSIGGITDAIEAWLQSEQQRREEQETVKPGRPENNCGNNTAISERAPDARTQAAAKVGVSGKPMTPGMAYAADYLDMSEIDSESEWVARNINDGFFVVCSRCHFLHLPTMPYWQGIPENQPQPVDACDVCALVPCASSLPFVYDHLRQSLASASAELTKHRQARAKHLFDMWMGASLAADTWVLAAMGEALEGVKAEAQGASS